MEQTFLITLSAVIVMLVYALPGYLLVKGKKMGESSIPAFVTLLLYICQPCLTVNSFQEASKVIHKGSITLAEMALMGGVFLLLSLLLQGAFLGLFYLIFRKKQEQVEYRIFVIASALGNCGFFGIPMLTAVLPDHPEAAMFSAVNSLVMNALCWTVASAIITRDRRHMSLKRILLNPNTISALVALPLFFTDTVLPEQVGDMVLLLAKFSSPLCMMILGMRLATVSVPGLFGRAGQYLMVGVKNVVFPLFAFAILYFLPVASLVKQVMLILCCCPVANVVLSFSEMLGQGQKTAANVVILSTLGCLLSLPALCLLLPLL